jgi:hypothetical protein
MEFTLNLPFVRDLSSGFHVVLLLHSGCSCRFFRIHDFVEQSFTLEEKARVFAEVRANSVAIRKGRSGSIALYRVPARN